MDIELLLAHPKQGRATLQESNQRNQQYHFHIDPHLTRYGSGLFTGLELLAEAVSSLFSAPSFSDSPAESVESFSVGSSILGEDSDLEEGKVKPKRKRANARQLEVLKRTFKQTPFPDSDVRRRLAKELGMTPRSVQIWFQNQRQLARSLVPSQLSSRD